MNICAQESEKYTQLHVDALFLLVLHAPPQPSRLGIDPVLVDDRIPESVADPVAGESNLNVHYLAHRGLSRLCVTGY